MQGRGASMAEPAAPGRWRLGSEEAGGSLLASALRQVHSGTVDSEVSGNEARCRWFTH